jgi:hypothetical protein
MVNYYRDMWPCRSHILSPLTSRTGAPQKGVKLLHSNGHQKCKRAFEEMKALMTAEVLCAYPNHNQPFNIYTDSSVYQLRACIMQDNCLVAYYCRKLYSAQCNYATIDKTFMCHCNIKGIPINVTWCRVAHLQRPQEYPQGR